MSKMNLSAKQQEVVNHLDGALIVEAGPGSGKTRVLTERVKKIVLEQEGFFKILALTFTNKAANEMKERLSELKNLNERTFIGTVHNFCLTILETRGKLIGYPKLPLIYESSTDRRILFNNAILNDPYLKDRLMEVGDSKEQSKLITRWMGIIDELKSEMKSPDDVEDYTIQRAYTSYDSELRNCNAIDFNDILFLAYKILVTFPQAADFFRRQYKYVCIDEAQDINEGQFKLINALLGDNHKNLMIVGDPKQAIYLWNGASPKYMDQIKKKYNAKSIILSDNFRSSQAVVSLAEKVMKNYTVEGKLPIQGEVYLTEALDENAEADEVIGTIQYLFANGHRDIEGPVTPENCAIIARNKYYLANFEEKLKDKGIPYGKLESNENKFESTTVKGIYCLLKLINNPQDKVQSKHFLENLGIRFNGTPVDLKAFFNQSLSGEVNLAFNVLRTVFTEITNPDDFNLNEILKSVESLLTGLPDVERELSISDLDLLKKSWVTFLKSSEGGKKSLTSYLSFLALGLNKQEKVEGVSLLTVHASKGLEFNYVAIVGLAEGVFPDYRVNDQTISEEESNIFVAITRSRRLLHLSYPKKRKMPWGDVRFMQRSRFLETLLKR